MPIAVPNAHASSSRGGRTRVIDSEEDAPPRKPNINGDGENEEDLGWTKETYVPQPFEHSRDNEQFFTKTKDQMQSLYEKVALGLTRAKDAAKAIEDASPDDELIEEMDGMFRRGIEQMKMIEIKFEVLKDLEQQLKNRQPLVDVIQRYEERTKRMADEWMSFTPRNKFKENEDYIAFRTEIWASSPLYSALFADDYQDVNHNGDGCPPMTFFLPHEDGDDSDDDIEMVGQTQTYRCPLTLRPYEDAVTSSKCKHSYSGEAIRNMIQNKARAGGKKGKSKCPHMGCQVQIGLEDLVPDPNLQRRTDQAEKRRKEREEDENEDGEMVG